MRVALLVLAACSAAPLCAAAAADPTGPDKARPRSVYPGHQRPVASPISDHFAFRASFFPASIATDVHVDPAAGIPGTAVSAERDLGQPQRLYQGRGELMFRLRERSRLRVDYFGSDRTATATLNRDIVFGAHTFRDRDVTQTDVQFSMLSFTYTYSLLRTERFEVGAGVGVHLFNAEARGTDQTLQQHAESSADGAIPTLAIDGTWRISTRFAWTARAQYISATVHNNSGSLGDYHTDVQYRWQPNFAVGLGYEYIRAQVEVSHGNTPGGFALRVSGPELFFRVSF